MPVVLTKNAYGKSGIRLTRVTRLPDRHELRELTVDVRLEGDFEASYTLGDNTRVIATDTMKNVVYALAQGRPAEAVEDFSSALSRYFLAEFSHVSTATVHITEHPWQRIMIDGNPHPHAFLGGGSEMRSVTVTGDRGGMKIEAGLHGLLVLKTTGSGFSGFVRDRYTTLPETTDRVFATEVEARWSYDSSASVDWDEAHSSIRTALIEAFTGHESLAVQQTLHTMGEAALAACPAVNEITLTLPNKHRILVDLERFGQTNVNEIFVATDEPFGLITGTLRRS